MKEFKRWRGFHPLLPHLENVSLHYFLSLLLPPPFPSGPHTHAHLTLKGKEEVREGWRREGEREGGTLKIQYLSQLAFLIDTPTLC